MSRLFGNETPATETLRLETATRLCATSKVAVVGESHHQPALEAVAGRRVSEGIADALPVLAVLVPEPSNEHDRHAVRVDVDGRTVGYLPPDRAGAYQPVLLNLAREGRYGWCPGLIVGGGGKSYGMQLHLADPDRLLFANETDGLEMLHGEHMVTITGFYTQVVARLRPGQHGLFPPLAASLSVGEVAKGESAGKPCIDVWVNGRRAGSFTPNMSDRYLGLVRPVLEAGQVPGCELMVRREEKRTKAFAFMPQM